MWGSPSKVSGKTQKPVEVSHVEKGLFYDFVGKNIKYF